jgi:hypothetical protein
LVQREAIGVRFARQLARAVPESLVTDRANKISWAEIVVADLAVPIESRHHAFIGDACETAWALLLCSARDRSIGIIAAPGDDPDDRYKGP